MLIGTWNVNGLRARFAELQRWTAEHRPDVFCLQEIKATASQVPEPLTALPEYHNHWHGGPGGYSGVSIHVRRAWSPAAPHVTVPELDIETRIVTARVGDVELASVYVPNGGKDYDAKLEFLRGLRGYVSGVHAAGRRLVLCGDLNVALTDADVHPRNRDPDKIGQRAEERALLQAVLDEGLVDTIRAANPDRDDLFTWWPPWRNEKAKNRGWRIDFVAVSAPLAPAAAVTVLRDFGHSDHAPVLVELG